MTPLSLFRSAIKANGKVLIFYQAALLTLVMMVTYILYCMKDSLLVHHLGPEAVVLVRSYLITPAIFLFFLLYTKMLNWFNQIIVFSSIIVAFIFYYVLFAFYFYPNLELVTPNLPVVINGWPEMAQIGAQLLIKWPITLHYMISELWVTFVLGVMTWQLFNSINTKESASEVYYILQLIANLAITIAGLIVYQSGKSTVDNWQLNLKIQTVLIVILALLMIVVKSKLVFVAADLQKSKAPFEKLKLSLKESLKLIVASSQLRLLFIMMFSYGICNSFLETTNRHYLKTACASIQEYNHVVAVQAVLIGILTIAFIFLGGYLSSLKKYKLSVKITPLILAVCAVSVLILTKLFPASEGIWLLLLLSIAQLVLVKASKYGLIDPVKEMSYISLDKELKNKGKAAVDSISNRFGKTGGNILQQGIFIIAGSLSVSVGIFGIFILIFAFFWLRTANSLEV